MTKGPTNSHNPRTFPAKFALLTAALVLLALAPAGASAAPPPLLSQFCEEGLKAGQCSFLRGVATDPSTGDIYVASLHNSRIEKFTAWTQFVRAWGGGVVTGGASGSGDLSAGSSKVTSIAVTGKAFLPGQEVTGAGIAAGTTVENVGVGTLELSKPATASGSGVSLTVAEGAGNVPTNERQLVAIGGAPSGGSFTLTHTTGHTEGQFTAGSNQLKETESTTGTIHVGDSLDSTWLPGTTVTAIDTAVGSVTLSAPNTVTGGGGINTSETTAPIPFNASAATVQAALEALTDIGSGNVTVSGPAGGPYEVEFKGPRLADTDVVQMKASAAGLTPSGTVTVTTAVDGAGAIEVCTGAECTMGTRGPGPGQLNDPEGVAVDSHGDVYVVDGSNHRVQKFDSEGNFLLMFGGGVDQGPNHAGNLCTAQYIAEDEVCGAGSEGKANGQFGKWPGGSFIAVGPGDKVYVGDEERIQRFDAGGNYVESIALPGETVKSLAVDPLSGNLYIAFSHPSTFFSSKENVLELSPAGAVLATLPVKDPRALATDATGNLYVVDGEEATGDAELEVRKFTSAGKEVPDFTFADGFDFSLGIAAGSACGIDGVDLYVSNHSHPSYIRAYGPPPDPSICPPPAVSPTISDQHATSVDSNGATVKAEINPHFWPDTRYYVQYGTGKCSEGGCNREQPLAPGSKLTTATLDSPLTTAGVFIGGLEPDTVYHYRFVAQSSGGGPVRGVGGEVGKDGEEEAFTTFPTAVAANTNCPNQAFRTGAASKLPDCRAYEMVSPLDKNNGDIQAAEGFFFTPFGWRTNHARIDQATPDGEKITYGAERAFAGAPSAGWSGQYLSSRDPQAGWSTHSISPPRGIFSVETELSTETPFRAFSEDLCSAWVFDESDYALAPGAPAGVPNLYRRDLCGEGGYELLSSVAPPGYSAEIEKRQVTYFPGPQGFVPDGARTVFHAGAKLTERACSEKGVIQLYETTAGGPLRLVSALPNGQGTCKRSSLGTGDIKNSQGRDFRADSVANAVSADGARIYWTEDGPVGGNFGGPGRIYLRINPDQPQSAISEGKCNQPARACTIAVSGPESAFLTADPSGALMIYGQKTPAGEELYEAQIEKEGGQLVAHSTLIAKAFKGLLGASEDATRLYFASKEVLAPGATDNKLNFYLREKGAGTRFVVTLAGIDDAGGGVRTDPEYFSSLNSKPSFHSARVSPDGLHAAFMSRGSLTGYDNADVASAKPDAEVYLYDATANGGAGRLDCVSCNPSGARPAGRRTDARTDPQGAEFWTAAAIPGWESQVQPSRVLADDGSRLFFESFEALVVADTNGAQDVYEWEAAGSGDCTEESGAFSPSAGGCVSLISSGESPKDSEFHDASADGRDVFFTTGSSLLPQDIGLIDLYDARAGGGFPPPPPPVPACEGEACQGPLAPPNDPTPGSSSFEGAGNVVEKPAKKKHKKKAHKKKHKAKKRADHKRRAAR
jgi:hypothetical protein